VSCVVLSAGVILGFAWQNIQSALFTSDCVALVAALS
jgi:hypothetical protein